MQETLREFGIRVWRQKPDLFLAERVEGLKRSEGTIKSSLSRSLFLCLCVISAPLCLCVSVSVSAGLPPPPLHLFVLL